TQLTAPASGSRRSRGIKSAAAASTHREARFSKSPLRLARGRRGRPLTAMDKAGRHLIMGGGGGGGGRKMGPPGAPAMGLQKQNSWSPDIERDEVWERRRRGMRRGGGSALRVRSVTDDDLEELRGCIDLGFGFEPPPAAGSGCAACGGAAAGRTRLLETLPALDLYYAVHGGGGAGAAAAEGCACSCGAASEVSSEESPLGSPMSILSPGDTPETVKMRLKQWAQVVALSMMSRH
ncbi:unnamed protein product, partial [Urochloa humidicola]